MNILFPGLDPSAPSMVTGWQAMIRRVTIHIHQLSNSAHCNSCGSWQERLAMLLALAQRNSATTTLYKTVSSEQSAHLPIAFATLLPNPRLFLVPPNFLPDLQSVEMTMQISNLLISVIFCFIFHRFIQSYRTFNVGAVDVCLELSLR